MENLRTSADSPPVSFHDLARLCGVAAIECDVPEMQQGLGNSDGSPAPSEIASAVDQIAGARSKPRVG